ncbi:MAG: HNH endonuclease signature motif containing protein [Actinomycetota bacterium]
MPMPQKKDPPKVCRACGRPFKRRRFNGRLEDRTRFLSREHCSQACASSRTEVTKDTMHWRARRWRRANCAECGASQRLHVHHRDRDPSNNEPTNLETLCASCHLKLHWREDRDERLAAIRRGGHMRLPSGDGR